MKRRLWLFHNLIKHLSPAHRQQVLASAAILSSTRQIGNIRIRRQRRSNLSAGLDLSNLNQSIARLVDSLSNGICTLSLALSSDNVSLPLLLGLLDDETGSLGVLLGNLLLLDGLGELAAESHVGNGYILQGDVELGGTAGQLGSDALGNSLSLGDELGSIELGDGGLEDFVADGWQDTLVVVDTEVLLQMLVSNMRAS